MLLNSKKIIKFFNNITIILGILFSIIIIVIASYKLYNTLAYQSFLNHNVIKFYIIYLIIGFIFLFFFYFSLSFSIKSKTYLSIIFLSLFVSAYSFEFYIGIKKYFSNEQLVESERIILNMEKAKNLGIDYDPRTKVEFISDKRKKGLNIYPNYIPKLLISSNGVKNQNTNIFPLGGMSNTMTTFQNESGNYPIIKTDKYGFNNIEDLYKQDDIDIILLGDSFVEGYSVNPSQTIQSELNKLNFKTISLGKGGNGPLLELATLREYAKNYKPKIIIWFYYRNDLTNLKDELNSKILRNYLLNDQFSQNLIDKQEKINIILKKYVEKQFNNYRNIEAKKIYSTLNKFLYIVKLTHLRSVIKFAPSSMATENELSTFHDILLKAKNLVQTWNGKMYFVYLPSYEFFLTGKHNEFRKDIIQTIIELDIPSIDIYSEVFELNPNPKLLFPTVFCPPCHYNAEGYRLVAEAIAKQINLDTN